VSPAAAGGTDSGRFEIASWASPCGRELQQRAAKSAHRRLTALLDRSRKGYGDCPSRDLSRRSRTIAPGAVTGRRSQNASGMMMEIFTDFPPLIVFSLKKKAPPKRG
jgi:hypothetical protein